MKLVDSGIIINVELGIEWEEYKVVVFWISVEDIWEIDKKEVLINEDFTEVE